VTSTVIQIYGRFDGYWSHSAVSRGIVKGLLANGVRNMRLHNVQQAYGDGADAAFTDLPDNAVQGYNTHAPIGFYIGGYPPMAEQWLIDHSVRGALFIAESETLPSNWGHVVNACDRIFVPSHWTKMAYQSIGMSNGKISILPHGVDEAFGVTIPIAKLSSPLRILHVAGAASFLDRKGTPQLIKAFRSVFKRGEATLTLRTPYFDEAPIRGYLGHHHDDIVLDPRLACPPAEMAQLIAQHHVVMQPSRAEAFGMIPCEARALGVPVALTACSGHAEHANEHDLFIRSGKVAPIIVNGIPQGGRAPSVSVGSIAKALSVLPTRLPAMREAAVKQAAAGYGERWSWKQKTRLLADWLQYQQRKLKRTGRVGRDLNEL